MHGSQSKTYLCILISLSLEDTILFTFVLIVLKTSIFGQYNIIIVWFIILILITRLVYH